MDRVRTGSDPLDAALGGGIPCGMTILVEGPQGMGSTEFALSLLRAASAKSQKALFATALRSPARARREATALFGEAPSAKLEFVGIPPASARDECHQLVGKLARGDVVALESTAALGRACEPSALVAMVEEVADAAHDAGVTVIYLHAPGTLPPDVENALGEAADGVFSFAWRDGGITRRRALVVSKLRGLAPMLDGEQVPIFEASLHVGVGFAVSRVRSVV